MQFLCKLLLNRKSTTRRKAMPENLKVNLPDEADMWQRLLNVVSLPFVINPEGLAQSFFPHIQQHAGKKASGDEVVLVVELALYDYVATQPPILARIMLEVEMPLIEVLIDDEEVKADALRAVNELIQERKLAVDG